MKITEIANQFNLPTSKIKELANEIFGFIPVEWDESQINSLKIAIQGTTKALLASTNSSSIVSTPPGGLNDQDKAIAEILGIDTIKANLKLYLGEISSIYELQIGELNELIFQTEQEFYNRLNGHQTAIQNESINRLKTNSNFWSSKVTATEDEELNTLLNLWNL